MAHVLGDQYQSMFGKSPEKLTRCRISRVAIVNNVNFITSRLRRSRAFHKYANWSLWRYSMPNS